MSQNLDVLSTFSGRKYGRLDVIQNPDSDKITGKLLLLLMYDNDDDDI